MTDLCDYIETVDEIAEKFAELNAFPCELLIPKTQTQQTKFLEKYPEYDGRGIVIAILDTGVDPALPGLQKTTTGERKIIDCVDCSGSGDVDTSTVRSPVDGIITGLTGRKLRIPTDWVNPSNKYHLGIKPLYELYNKGTLEKVMKDNKTHIWTPMHQNTMADSEKLLAEHEKAVGGMSDKLSEKYEREDLASRVDYLRSQMSVTMEDVGPVLDCLVWHDGKRWKACLDTSFRGRLKLCTPMGVFRETGEHSSFTDRDKATYSFRIGRKGDHLEIVTANGSHGSHVAGIAAAHYPENSKLSGLAPGAKIVSFTIGDNRLGSTESGTALIKAFSMCADYGVHVLNMSFGELSHVPNRGRVITQLHRLVSEFNVVCCVSAGNNGPSLSSVGSPGGTTSKVLGIGACLFPSMVSSLHSSLSKVGPLVYPWSSRGPAPDGDLGVSICAPGAARANIPICYRKSNSFMNGTSMSSPNAAGSVACLLSGLKARDMKWSYLLIRLALENTASKLENVDRFSQGNGILQIDNAFNYIMKHGQFLPEKLVSFEVGVKSGRGIYMREFYEKSNKVTVSCDFAPLTDIDQIINFEKNFILTCDAPWVTIPRMFQLVSGEENFLVNVDWEMLKPGTANYTEICAIDPENVEIGPYFRVPISVIVPVVLGNNVSTVFEFDVYPGIPSRHFIQAPPCATVMDVEVVNISRQAADIISFSCSQISRHTAKNRTTLNHRMLQHENKQSMNVIENLCTEVTVMKEWSLCDQPSKVRVNVRFRGANVYRPVVLNHEASAYKLNGQIAFEKTVIKPRIEYYAYNEVIRQSCDYKIEPLGPEDLILGGLQIYRLVLTYKYTVTNPSSYCFILPGLSDYIYDSFVDCMRIHIYNSDKKFVAASGPIPRRYTTHLSAGDYIIKAQIRHTEFRNLEGFRDLCLNVASLLTKPIMQYACDYSALDQMTGVDSSSGGELSMNVHGEFACFFNSLSPTVINSLSPKAGSYLLGYLRLFSDSSEHTCAQYCFGVDFRRTSTGLSKVIISSKKKPELKTEQEKLDEALRDFKLGYIKKLQDHNMIKTMFDELISKYPTHIPVLMAKLNKMNENLTHFSTEELEELEELVEKVIELCNPNEVLQWLGCRRESQEGECEELTDMDFRKDTIIKALLIKTNAYADCHLSHSTLRIPASVRRKTDSIMSLTKSIVDDVSEETDRKKNEEGDNKEDVICLPTESENSTESDPTKDEPEKKNSTAAEIDEKDEIEVTNFEKQKDISEKDKDSTVVLPAKVSREKLDVAYRELIKWLSPNEPRVLLLAAKQALAHEHFGSALQFLEKFKKHLKSQGRPKTPITQISKEICEILGWIHLSNLYSNEILLETLPDFRPFQCS